jgi:hypothetical protein
MTALDSAQARTARKGNRSRADTVREGVALGGKCVSKSIEA